MCSLPKTLWLCAALALSSSLLELQVPAATNYVTNGQSIQAAVDAASDGDTLVIFGGTYAESVTLNKWLSLQRLAGQTVYIAGNLTVNGVKAVPEKPLVISNLKVGGDETKGLVVINSANVMVYNVEMRGFNCTASEDIVVANTTLNSYGTAELRNSTIMLSRSLVSGHLHVDNREATNNTLSVLQCTNYGHITVDGGISRLLYSKLYSAIVNGADSVIIGNSISRRDGGLAALEIRNGKAIVRNNLIQAPQRYGYVGGGHNNGIYIENVDTLIANNCIQNLQEGDYNDGNDGNGVWVNGSSKKVEIVGNVFWGTRQSVTAPFDNVVYRYNNDVDGLSRHVGGVIAEGVISKDPLFVDRTNNNYQLTPESPCRNAGPPEPWWNDRDGTRNDIGMYGGAAYDPDGWTTDKPITFLLQATPLTVIKGVHTDLTIFGGGIVVPK